MKTFDYILAAFLTIGGIWLIIYFKGSVIGTLTGIFVTAMGLLQLYIIKKSD